MKYKRLTNTNREEYNPELDFCTGCKYYGEPNGCNRPNGTCDNYDRFMETYQRLEEIEDKIENGTLIELPCKVGDKLYCINTFRPTLIIEIFIISKIEIMGNYAKYIILEDYKGNKFFSEHIGETYFLTLAEAEKKLKELNNENT